MQIKTKKFLEILRLLSPGLARKEIIEGSTHFIFTENAISTFNDRVYLSHPLPGCDFVCSIKAQGLYKTVQGIKVKDDEDVMELNFDKDNSEFKIKATKTSAKLKAVLNPTILETIEDIQDLDKDTIKYEPIMPGFNEGVALCLFSVSKNKNYGPYANVGVIGDHVFSTDNLRISQYKLGSKTNEAFLIPLSVAMELANFKVAEYYIGPKWAHLLNAEGVSFSFRKGEGIFSDLSAHFVDPGDKVIQIPKATAEMIQSAVFMCEGIALTDKVVSLSFGDGVIKCKSEHKDIGSIEKEIDFTYNEKLEILVNPVLFSQVLEGKDNLMMSLSGDRALFTSGDFMHIVALPTKR